jgi:phosphoserine phosphatase
VSPASRSRLAFSSVALDVDSTLCGLEGIDFLAARRGEVIGAEIARVTDRAMRGEIPLERIYGERLTVIRPARADIAALSAAYASALAPDAAAAIRTLRDAGVRMALVSGGIRQAILPIGKTLGFADDEVEAVSLAFDAAGEYAGYDTASPLTTQRGKAAILGLLVSGGRLTRPLLAVGDGSTDVAMAESADAFAAYTGFARRQHVVEHADVELQSFAELTRFVLRRVEG